MLNKKQQGFTLIELLVVIAIIGILSSVVLASLNTAREKANQASVQSNLKTISVQAEMYYDDHDQSYGSSTPAAATCTGGMFEDPTIAQAIAGATDAGAGAANRMCAIGTDSQTWAISVEYKSPATGAPTSWCSDSTGYAGDDAAGDVAEIDTDDAVCG